MTERKSYTMEQADLDKLMAASQPTLAIKVGKYSPSTPQENANMAWNRLGAKMGFDGSTAMPDGPDPLNFTAIPTQTPET